MIDPQRRRLTVGRDAGLATGSRATATAATAAMAKDPDQLTEEFGVKEIFRRAEQDGKKAALIVSIMDQAGSKKKEFADKDTEMAFNSVFESKDAFAQWLADTKLAFNCHKGKKPDAPNQDSFSIVMVEDEFSLYCVFDGHGPCGHQISELARSKVIREFLVRRETDPKQALKDAFVTTQDLLEERLANHEDPDSSMSGTTGTVAYHDIPNEVLYIAHVGDSRSIISHGSEGRVEALTEDHKPNNPGERQRIEAKGGRVIFDGYYNHRVFSSKGHYPGLNMSRALGDVVGHKEAGLTAEPDIREWNLSSSSEPQLLLLCTDGVWEFIENEEAMRLALMGKKLPDLAAQDLKKNLAKVTSASYTKWMKDSDDEISDDITGIAVVLRARS